MTQNRTSDTSKIQRYRKAAEWLVRLHAPGATDNEVDEWLRWCEADSENLAAFDKLQQDWQDTEGFKGAPALLNGPTLPRSAGNSLTARSWSGWRSTPVRWAVAASIVFTILMAYGQWTRRPIHEVIAVSQHEPATLPDGSSLLLSAKATADVDFTSASRQITLSPGAEAYMKVRHDTARPFIVRAGAMTVTAVGTAFDVRRDADHVIVTVEEGTILAAAVGPNGPTQWRVGADYQVDYSDNVRNAAVSRVDTQAALRWRDGELAYDDAPLDTVIADINRYSTVHIVARDPAIGRLRYTGTVFVASVKDWVKALEAQYPIHARISPDGEIEIESPAAAPGSATH